LLSFRRQYPDGQNYVVSYDVDRTLSKDYNGISVSFVNLNTLIDDISQHH